MTELFIILKDIILPVFILMAIGFFLHKKFTLDLNTLAKMNIYFLVPGFIFVKLYNTSFSLGLFLEILAFFSLYVFILYISSLIAGKGIGLGRRKKTVFSNSVMFFNSGNYGVPVNDLVFRSDPFAMSIQVIVLTLQNIFIFSYGIFSLQSMNTGKLKAMLGYFKMPILYAMLIGVIMNIADIPVPSFIWVPANYISEALIAIALVTLGAQVARFQFNLGSSSVYFSILIRLVIGPLIALAIIFAFRIEGVTAQALFIASAMPTSVNSAVIAQEYDNHPDFAAQVVMFSTLFSAITVTMVVYAARLIF